MPQCQCKKPQFWTDNTGKVAGNMCKKCGERIEVQGASKRGRFLIAAEKAVADLKLPESVQEELWTLLHTNVSQWVRQSYLTADYNAKVKRMVAT